jgi:hypothetical protein
MGLFDQIADNYFATAEDGTPLLWVNRKAYVLPSAEKKREAHEAIKRHWMLQLGVFLVYLAIEIPSPFLAEAFRIDFFLFTLLSIFFMMWIPISVVNLQTMLTSLTQGLVVRETARGKAASKQANRVFFRLALLVIGLILSAFMVTWALAMAR